MTQLINLLPARRLRRAAFAATAAACGFGLTPTAGAAPPSGQSTPIAAQASPLEANVPTLAERPGALVNDAGARGTLTLALPASPQPNDVRAAIVAAGRVQRAAGRAGLPVRVVTGRMTPSARPISADGPVIIIDDRPGRPTLALDRLATGQLRLTIGGNGEGLLSATRLLSSPAIGAFTARSATVPAGIAPRITEVSVQESAPVTPVQANGQGQLTATAQFTVPLTRQMTGDNALELVTAYAAPGGGHIDVRLNGGLLSSIQEPASGQMRNVSKVKLAGDPTLSGDTVPGWWAHPGANQVTLTAVPARKGAEGTLQLIRGSQLWLHTRARPAELQLGLWPFPIYSGTGWSQATVVLPAQPNPAALGATISALSSTEPVTGIPADPQVAFGSPTAAQAAGNLMFVGSAATAAAGGHMRAVGRLHPTQAGIPGMLEEVRLPHGGIGLLAYGNRALGALGPGYRLGSLAGRAVLVDPQGRSHTVAAGAAVPMFATPRWPWLTPAAFLAVLALGWIAVRAVRARRRLTAMEPFEVAGGPS